MYVAIVAILLDMGFYLFSLPLYDVMCNLLLVVGVVALIGAVAVLVPVLSRPFVRLGERFGLPVPLRPAAALFAPQAVLAAVWILPGGLAPALVQATAEDAEKQ